jgi:Transglutaminase-like superfamily
MYETPATVPGSCSMRTCASGPYGSASLSDVTARVNNGPARPTPKPVLIAEILSTYAVTRWRMPRGEIRDVVRATRGGVASAPGAPEHISRETWAVAARLARAVTRTLRVLPTDSRCLVQSLVLSRLLATRGIPSTLVIGARSDDKFMAHAWVEHGGYPLLPQEGFDEYRLLEL